MSVPDHRHFPRKIFETGLFNLKTHEGQGAFVDAVVSALHAMDENWRHLRKKKGQTAVHGHAEDAALYLLPNDEAIAVDFIGGAGGPNPQPAWIVQSGHVYKHADALDPNDHGMGMGSGAAHPVTLPGYEALGGDSFFRAMVGVPLEADYLMAGQHLNDGAAVWFSRATYRLMAAFVNAKGEPVNAVGEVRTVRNEWRAALGLPSV